MLNIEFCDGSVLCTLYKYMLHVYYTYKTHLSIKYILLKDSVLDELKRKVKLKLKETK